VVVGEVDDVEPHEQSRGHGRGGDAERVASLPADDGGHGEEGAEDDERVHERLDEPVGPAGVGAAEEAVHEQGVGPGEVAAGEHDATDPDLIYATADLVYMSRDGGETWVALRNQLPLVSFDDIALDAVAEDLLYLAADGRSVSGEGRCCEGAPCERTSCERTCCATGGATRHVSTSMDNARPRRGGMRHSVDRNGVHCGPMMRPALLLTAALLGLGAAPQDEGFVPLFNGTSLDGWVNINCAPDTFGVKDGVITVTGVPICEIRTKRMYENFVLELEYQHQQAKGNAGVFVWADALPARGQPFLRAIEVQVLDGRNTETYTSHGDVFSIHGATMTPDRPHPAGAMRSLPSERRAKGPGEWNHYRITADRGTIKLAVNGKEVSGGYDISPRKGYIALESEGAPVLFRNIRIRELPSAAPLPEEMVAAADAGHTALYDSKTFAGWTRPADEDVRWTTHDWRLAYAGPTGSTGKPLLSSESYGDVEVIADWRWVDEQEPAATAPSQAQVTARHLPGVRAVVQPHAHAAMQPAGRWNRVVQRLRGNRLTVTLNGTTIVDDVAQDGLPSRGRIALVPVGRQVEFANIFVKPL